MCFNFVSQEVYTCHGNWKGEHGLSVFDCCVYMSRKEEHGLFLTAVYTCQGNWKGEHGHFLTAV